MTCDRLRGTDVAAFLAEPRDPAWEAFRAHYPGCPECSGELARWSDFEEALREVTQSRQPHPAEERLLAFRRTPEALPAAEREALAAHLAACAPCRDALEATASFDLTSVLARAKPARPVDAPTPSGLWEKAVDALRGLFALPAPALVALAVAALAVLLGLPVLLRGGAGPAPEASPPVAHSPAREAPPIAQLPEPEPPAPALPPEPEPAQSEAIAEAPAREPAAPPVELAEAPKPAPEPPAQVAEMPPPTPLPAPEPAARPVPPARPTAPERAAPGGLITTLGPEPVRFVARSGLPSGRVGGAARSAAAAGAPPVALVPESVALTLEAQPTFYWYLPQPSAAPIEVRVNDVDALKPVLSARIPAPVPAGFHAVRLRDHGARLAAGHHYEWLVSLPDDPEGSGGIVQRVEADPELTAKLGSADPAARLRLLAGSGIWVDALDLVSRSIAQRPADAELRRARASLLEQAGLAAAAASDRAGR